MHAQGIGDRDYAVLPLAQLMPRGIRRPSTERWAREPLRLLPACTCVFHRSRRACKCLATSFRRRRSASAGVEVLQDEATMSRSSSGSSRLPWSELLLNLFQLLTENADLLKAFMTSNMHSGMPSADHELNNRTMGKSGNPQSLQYDLEPHQRDER